MSKTSVFLSYAKPFMKEQEQFVESLCLYLQNRNIEPKTLGVTEYSMSAPLVAIRRLMIESNGLITIAFRRIYIERGVIRPNSDIDVDSRLVNNKWLTSPFCHIEPAMAYQLGLPILILRENGVIDDGVLEKGVTGLYMPEFDLQGTSSFLISDEWLHISSEWESLVKRVAEKKGMPLLLY